jgi:hypothetical protein
LLSNLQHIHIVDWPLLQAFTFIRIVTF